MTADDQPTGFENQQEHQWSELKLLLPDHLFRAWQRCSWMITYETGKTRAEIMQDMIRDFLHKHGC